MTSSPTLPSPARPRPAAHGKSILLGDEKLLLRGVTYGTFRPGLDGEGFAPEQVRRDFAAMSAWGINAVRTYTVPPMWLLDEAAMHGLWVLVGVPWEQHICFLDDRHRARAIGDKVSDAVRSKAGHPALLGYLVGNEIPSPIVRWHGRGRVERFLNRLANAAKDEDPDALVGYANFPSTEYLQLPCFDFSAFNVFLESQSAYSAYLARLHNLASDRPLLITETGLDSRRNGLEAQADAVAWQIRGALGSGCAGVFAFSWTDEWHRGGVDVEDWDFGLVTRDRAPKPALAGASSAFASALASEPAPTVSVVVCTYNGARTLKECLRGVQRLRYSNYELLVIIDGSTDDSEQIAKDAGARVITTPNRGLSHARNVGMNEARGDIIAYIDDDAYPDSDWLHHLTATFSSGGFGAVGGPNLPPSDEPAVARCVSNAPGGPIHVLLSDEQAEHIPGCNMAFRRERLAAIDGFDTRYRIAGDDVDVCWRLQQSGETIGFSPGAVVWHRRRPTIRSYLRQQYNYGRAEALLERKWPEHYNRAGHLRWRGRIYAGESSAAHPLRGSRVNYGRGGTGLFQSLYTTNRGSLRTLPLTPEWGLVVLVLVALAALGLAWTPLLWTLPLLAISLSVPVIESVAAAKRAFRHVPRTPRRVTLGLRLLTASLWLLQPPARLVPRPAITVRRLRRGGRLLGGGG